MPPITASLTSLGTVPGLTVAAKVSEKGYVVELSMPLDTLRELTGTDWDEEASMLVGAFRAEFSATDGGEPKEEWIVGFGQARSNQTFTSLLPWDGFEVERRSEALMLYTWTSYRHRQS